MVKYIYRISWVFVFLGAWPRCLCRCAAGIAFAYSICQINLSASYRIQAIGVAVRQTSHTFQAYSARQALKALRCRTVRKAKAKEQRRAKHANRKPPRIVTTWSGMGVGKAICIGEPQYPPEIICLTNGMAETLGFIDGLRARTLRDQRESRKSAAQYRARGGSGRRAQDRVPRISGYVDFSKITMLGTGAAVVLTALFDRLRRKSGRVPPTINLHEWSNAAFTVLFELGFFEIVGHTSVNETFRDSSNGDVRTMAMISGTNSDELRYASESILQLSKFIDDDAPLPSNVQKALNSALGEAMTNVANHAYPDDCPDQSSKINRWWISASANRSRRSLTVVVYDQGATIPWTLPKRSWASTFSPSRLVSNVVSDHPFPLDSDYIEYALGEGSTQTERPERGQGLPQMRDLVRICGGGSLTILSRGGKCCYRPGVAVQLESLPVPLEGTLIEWEMHLPRAA